MDNINRIVDESWNKKIPDDDARVRILVALFNQALSRGEDLSFDKSMSDLETEAELDFYMAEYRARLAIEKETRREAMARLDELEKTFAEKQELEKEEVWKQEANHRYRES